MVKEKDNYLKKELYKLIKTDSTFFEFIQEGSLDGLWYWNLEKIEDEWMSPKFWKVLGYDPQKRKHNPSEWQDIIFQEDLKKANKNLEKHIKDPNYSYDQTVRYKHKNGSTVWIRCRGIAVRNEEGQAIRMLGAHTDITAIKQQEKSLKESVKRQKTIVQSLDAGVIIHAPDGTVIDSNDRAGELLRLTKNQLIGKTLIDPGWKFIDKAEKSLPLEKYPVNLVLENRKIIQNLIIGVIVSSYNNVVWVTVNGVPIFDNSGNLTEVVISFTDITEMNTANKKVDESKERYRQLHDTMIQGVVYQDNQGSILSCNPAAEKLLGLSLAQMQDKAPIDPKWKSVDEDGKIINFENFPSMVALRTHKKIGPLIRGVYIPNEDTYIWLNITAIPLFKEGNKSPYQVYTILEDITNQRKAEKQLIYQHDLMDYIIQHMNSGIAVHDKNLNYIFASDMYKSQFNIDDAIIGKHHYDVFPDLPEKYRKVHQRCLKGEVVRGDRDKLFYKDGRFDWTQWESRPWYDENGDIAGIIIYTQVINNYVENEEKLKKSYKELSQSEEQYRLLANEMQLGLALHEIICDEQGNPIDFYILNANKSWEAIMGVKVKDFDGKTALEVFPNHDKSWIEVFGEVALNGKSTKYESYSPEFKKHLSTSVYSPKKGQFAVVVEDITEKKQQENLIKYAQRHDSLTKIPNRLHFDEKLLELDSEINYPLAILMMDINGLKLINDSFGQEAGNEVLKQFAAILRDEQRQEDFIARISGDEFAMLCPGISYDDIIQLNQRLIHKVSLQRINDIEYSIAIGSAIKKTHDQDIFKILTDAENAIHKNKIVYGQGTRSAAIESIFSTLTNKYAYEKTHSQRVAKYSRLIGEHFKLREDELNELELAGRLHDIGKIAINDDIIMKPGKLTSEEWENIKNHTVIGYQILRAADKYSNLAEYAMSHHERIDGNGYPNGLKGNDIPLFARIISVADAYEAMTADRTYRKVLDIKEAIHELKTHAGTQFDATVVDVFIRKVLLNV